MEAPDYLALRQVCLAKVRGGYRPALGMFPCVLDYSPPPGAHICIRRWAEVLKIDRRRPRPRRGDVPVRGTQQMAALCVIMRRNPTGIDDRNPAPEPASRSSGVIFPRISIAKSRRTAAHAGTSYVGQTRAKVDDAKAAFTSIAFAPLTVSQSARTSSLEFYSSSHVPALLWKVGQASTRALLF